MGFSPVTLVSVLFVLLIIGISPPPLSFFFLKGSDRICRFLTWY